MLTPLIAGDVHFDSSVNVMSARFTSVKLFSPLPLINTNTIGIFVSISFLIIL